MYRTLVSLFALSLMYGTAQAQLAPLDPQFGGNGFRTYGFPQAGGPDNGDVAGVACAGPANTLVVSGATSAGNRIGTVRLRADGSLDPDFGIAGQTSFALVGSGGTSEAPGACQADGKLLLARSVRNADGSDENLQIVRILPASGQPDPDYGQNGVVTLDLDLYRSGLGAIERAQNLNLDSNGELLLTGYANFGSNGSTRGVVARLRIDGSIAAVSLNDLPGLISHRMATAGMVDGQLWVAGEGLVGAGGLVVPFRATLDAVTLQPLSVALANAGNRHASLRGGRLIRPGLLVAVGGLQTGNAIRPALFLFRPDGYEVLPLPANAPETAAALTGIAPLPGNRVFLAWTSDIPRGIYMAVARLGAASGSTTLDTSFGDQGAVFVPFVPAGCTTTPTIALTRVTLWNGQPTLSGTLNTGTCGSGNHYDFLVSRIRLDRLFDHNFSQ